MRYINRSSGLRMREYLESQGLLVFWGQWNTDGGLGEQMVDNACVSSESHSPANTEHWPPAHSHPSAFIYTAVTPLFTQIRTETTGLTSDWSKAMTSNQVMGATGNDAIENTSQIPSIFPWKHTIALLWKNKLFTHPHIVPNLYNFFLLYTKEDILNCFVHTMKVNRIQINIWV